MASRALCRRGHEVHVFHCADAFQAVRGRHPLRPYEPPPGLHVHRLVSGFGMINYDRGLGSGAAILGS